MFENFAMETRNREVVGYRFDCDNPKAVLCIIHGVGEHAGRYRRMASMLAESGIATVAFDLRGHGISQGKRGDCAPRQQVLEDVDALIEYALRFYPELPVTLYGHSMGGNICLDYKARGNNNSLPVKYIVSAPWIKLVKDFPKPVVSMLRAASKIAPRVTISQSFPEEQLGNLSNVRPYDDDPLVHNTISLRCAAECFDKGNEIFEGANYDNHNTDGKPFLLMHGDEDKICSVEGSRAVAARMKDSEGFRYVEWHGYYHEIHNGGKDVTGDEVIYAIKDFILA